VSGADDAIREALEPEKKPAKKKAARKRKKEDMLDRIDEQLEREARDLELEELREDQKRLEFMVSRWLAIARRGHSEHSRYFVTRGSNNISSKDYTDWREAIDDVMKAEK